MITTGWRAELCYLSVGWRGRVSYWYVAKVEHAELQLHFFRKLVCPHLKKYIIAIQFLDGYVHVHRIFYYYSQGTFSCKSDMWSFGVTLWEILTFAREQPLDKLSDDAIVENCNHYYRSDGLEVKPAQPSGCPREIYDMMCTCWSRDDAARPTFREIHMFLANKNMGFDPTEEKYGYSTTTMEQATLPLVPPPRPL